jgi:hypothetical protein
MTEIEWRAFIVVGVMVRRQMADQSQNKRVTYAKAVLESDRGRWGDAPVRHADFGLVTMGITEAEVRDFYTPGDWDQVCDLIDEQAHIETIAATEAYKREERERFFRDREKECRAAAALAAREVRIRHLLEDERRMEDKRRMDGSGL